MPMADALVEALARLAMDDDVGAGLAGGGGEHRIRADEVDAAAARPGGQHRQRMQQQAEHQLLALLGVERLAQAGLAAGHRAHRQHDMDGLQVRADLRGRVVAHRAEW